MDTAAAAEYLHDMRSEMRVVEDLPPELRPHDLAEAYAIQDGLVARLAGEAIGYKVACTNAIAQEALQIDRPVFGRLMDSTTHGQPASIEAARFTHRVVEAEFGIRIGTTVEPAGAGPHTPESITPYIAAVLPSIEIVDHRWVDWSVGALSVAADNAIHGCWVPGSDYDGDWTELDLVDHAVSVTVDGAEVTTGDGSAVLGHPLNVVAWLADELVRFDKQLRAGDLITTGVCTDVFEAEAGQQVVADFGVLGQVAITWT